MRRASPWAGLGIGFALLGVASLGIAPPPPQADAPPEQPARQPAQPGPGDGDSPAASAAAELVVLLPGASERSATASPHEGVTARSARAADVADRAVPVSIDVDRLGLSAPVETVGLRPDGSMELPAPSRAGWFRHGATHGDALGATVIAGHVDSMKGPGAFLPLREAATGDRVTVTGSDGDAAEYEVTDVSRYRKEALPTDALFSRSGPHRLVLITCGGAFDSDARSYTENLVVIAEPTP